MGHISPLISLYKHLNIKYKIIYFGLKDSMEEEECKRLNIEFYPMELYPFYRKKIFKNILTFFRLFKETKIIKEKFLKYNVKAIISSGGFVSIPLIYSFRRNKKVKKILIEPNIIMGLANKILKHFVNYICVQFPVYKGNKYILTGNPIEVINSTFDHPAFYLNEDLILFIGGSNGALEIVKIAYDYHIHFPKQKIFVITGNKYFGTYAFNNNAYVYKKITEISSIFNKFKIIVSRAGASTITELINTKSCVLLFPSKNVSANHQMKNANYMEDMNMAVVIRNYDEKSYLKVHKLFVDNKKINEIKNNLSAKQINNSTQNILNLILD